MYASFIFHWLHIPSISTQQNLKQNKFKWILFSYKYEVRIFNHILCSVNVDFKYVLSILKSKVMSCLFLQNFYCLYTTYSFFSGSHQNNIEGKDNAISDFSSPTNHTQRLLPVEVFLHSPTYIPQNVNVKVLGVYPYKINKKSLQEDDTYAGDVAKNLENINGKIIIHIYCQKLYFVSLNTFNLIV